MTLPVGNRMPGTGRSSMIFVSIWPVTHLSTAVASRKGSSRESDSATLRHRRQTYETLTHSGAPTMVCEQWCWWWSRLAPWTNIFARISMRSEKWGTRYSFENGGRILTTSAWSSLRQCQLLALFVLGPNIMSSAPASASADCIQFPV